VKLKRKKTPKYRSNHDRGSNRASDLQITTPTDEQNDVALQSRE